MDNIQEYNLLRSKYMQLKSRIQSATDSGDFDNWRQLQQELFSFESRYEALCSMLGKSKN